VLLAGRVQSMTAEGERTVTRAFRISEAVNGILNEKARKQQVSVNSLVNKQLASFAYFEKYYRKVDMIKISSAMLTYLLQVSSEKEIVEAARMAGADVPKTVILSRSGKVSLEGVLEFIWMTARYGNWYEYSDVDHDGRKTITLVHRFGPKGSLFVMHFLRAVFASAKLDPEISFTEHSVTVYL